MKQPTKRKKYEASFKLKVIEVAKVSNNCAAARTFDVTEKIVRDWRRNEDNLRNMPKEKCAMRRGSTRWPQLEDYVAEWVFELRQDGYIVTRNKIRTYALKWAQAHELKDFKATSGWCSRFMNRKNLSIRQRKALKLEGYDPYAFAMMSENTNQKEVLHEGLSEVQVYYDNAEENDDSNEADLEKESEFISVIDEDGEKKTKNIQNNERNMVDHATRRSKDDEVMVRDEDEGHVSIQDKELLHSTMYVVDDNGGDVKELELLQDFTKVDNAVDSEVKLCDINISSNPATPDDNNAVLSGFLSTPDHQPPKLVTEPASHPSVPIAVTSNVLDCEQSLSFRTSSSSSAVSYTLGKSSVAAQDESTSTGSTTSSTLQHVVPPATMKTAPVTTKLTPGGKKAGVPRVSSTCKMAVPVSQRGETLVNSNVSTARPVGGKSTAGAVSEAGNESFDVQVDDTVVKEIDADLLIGDAGMASDGTACQKVNTSQPSGIAVAQDDHEARSQPLSADASVGGNASSISTLHITKSSNQEDPKDTNPGKSVGTSNKQMGGKCSTSCNLWVSGLSSSTRAADLKSLFGKYGKVMGAKVVTNARTPGWRCYGFMSMSSADEMTKCIQHLHRTELHGRMISVERAKSSGPIKTAVDAGKVVNPTGVSATVVTNAKHTSTIATSNKGANLAEETGKGGQKKVVMIDNNNKGVNDVKDDKRSHDSHSNDKRRERDAAKSGYPGENKKSIKGHRDFRKSREQRDRDILSFEKIRAERERERLRQREKQLRMEERFRMQELINEQQVQRDIHLRQKEDARLLEKEKEKLRFEKEKLLLAQLEMERVRKERDLVKRIAEEKLRLEQYRLEEQRQALKRATHPLAKDNASSSVLWGSAKQTDRSQPKSLLDIPHQSLKRPAGHSMKDDFMFPVSMKQPRKDSGHNSKYNIRGEGVARRRDYSLLEQVKAGGQRSGRERRNNDRHLLVVDGDIGTDSLDRAGHTSGRESRPSRRHHGRSQNGAMREHLIAHKDDLKHASTRRGSRAADGAAVVDTSSRRDSKSSLRQEHSTLSSVNRRSEITKRRIWNSGSDANPMLQSSVNSSSIENVWGRGVLGGSSGDDGVWLGRDSYSDVRRLRRNLNSDDYRDQTMAGVSKTIFSSSLDMPSHDKLLLGGGDFPKKTGRRFALPSLTRRY